MYTGSIRVILIRFQFYSCKSAIILSITTNDKMEIGVGHLQPVDESSYLAISAGKL